MIGKKLLTFGHRGMMSSIATSRAASAVGAR